MNSRTTSHQNKKNQYPTQYWIEKKKNRNFSSIGNETSVSTTLTTPIQDAALNLSQSNRQERETKIIWIGKEEVQLFLFADDLILHLKIPPKD
jgi:hypothetical protein